MKQLYKAQDTEAVGVTLLLLHTLTSTCCSTVHMLQGGRQQGVWNLTRNPLVSGF